MDGTLAAVFLVASLTDMAMNDCPTACFDQEEQHQNLSFQLAKVEFQGKIIGDEAMIAYDFGRTFGPYQPTVAASMTNTGDLWLGAGARWSTRDHFGGPLFVEASLIPGLYFHGDGPDIGGALQFRSSLGAGVEFANGVSIAASYDHRSNADTQAINPGLETIAIKVSMPIR